MNKNTIIKGEGMENLRIPVHVGVILDGNRRFAKRLMKKPWKGHEWGAKKVKEFLKWLKEYGIRYATLYSLSLENLTKRPKKELEHILKIFEKEFSKVLKPNHEAHKYGVRIKIIGRVKLLPENLQKVFREVEKATRNYKNYFLNFAIAYGGKQEIVDAVKKVARKVKKGKIKPGEIDESVFEKCLYTNGMPPVDVLIRTGGEKRISNFLLWQCAYAELFFVDKMWPEFSKEDFVKILKEYSQRERRFGR